MLPRVPGVTRIGRKITEQLIGDDVVLPNQVRMRDGTVMYLDTRSRTEIGPFWSGDYELPVIRFLKSILAPNASVMDIGANVGLVTIPLANHLRSIGGGRMFAFEPVVANFNRLVQNVEANELASIVTVANVGLGERAGTLEISVESSNGSPTGNAVLTDALLDSDPKGIVSRIRIERLDDLDIAGVDVIKVDIEGAEIMFMRGATGYIARHRPLIFGEFNTCFIARFGHSVTEAADMLRPLSYRAFALGEKGFRLVEIVTDGMQELVFVPKGFPQDRLARAGIPLA